MLFKSLFYYSHANISKAAESRIGKQAFLKHFKKYFINMYFAAWKCSSRKDLKWIKKSTFLSSVTQCDIQHFGSISNGQRLDRLQVPVADPGEGEGTMPPPPCKNKHRFDVSWSPYPAAGSATAYICKTGLFSVI